MALPDLSANYGLFLIRQNPSTGERFFVSFVRGDLDVIVDTPGSGSWIYELAIVCGASQPTATSMTAGGYTSLILENLKR